MSHVSDYLKGMQKEIHATVLSIDLCSLYEMTGRNITRSDDLGINGSLMEQPRESQSRRIVEDADISHKISRSRRLLATFQLPRTRIPGLIERNVRLGRPLPR